MSRLVAECTRGEISAVRENRENHLIDESGGGGGGGGGASRMSFPRIFSAARYIKAAIMRPAC